MSKLLIACPIADKVLLPTMRAIIELDPVGYERADTVFLRSAPVLGQDSRDAIAAQYNEARALVLTGGYDALLTIECDMLPPANAIRRLRNCNADVAYGLYVLRRPPWEWNAYSVMEGMAAWPLSKVDERARVDWGEVVDVDGIGTGCTLIQRRVLEAMRFRADGLLHSTGERSYHDWYFAEDVRAAGFTQRCDTAVRCGHIHPQDEHGAPRPSIIWPTGDAPFYEFREFDV
jgi:hypothetical protein